MIRQDKITYLITHFKNVDAKPLDEKYFILKNLIVSILERSKQFQSQVEDYSCKNEYNQFQNWLESYSENEKDGKLLKLSNSNIYKIQNSSSNLSYFQISILLCEYLNRDIFPVNSRIKNCVTRIGLIPREFNVDEISSRLSKVIPINRHKMLFKQILYFIKTICTTYTPKCQVCSLIDICDYYHTRNEWSIS